jgi:hypothetical protein
LNLGVAGGRLRRPGLQRRTLALVLAGSRSSVVGVGGVGRHVATVTHLAPSRTAWPESTVPCATRHETRPSRMANLGQSVPCHAHPGEEMFTVVVRRALKTSMLLWQRGDTAA